MKVSVCFSDVDRTVFEVKVALLPIARVSGKELRKLFSIMDVLRWRFCLSLISSVLFFPKLLNEKDPKGV